MTTPHRIGIGIGIGLTTLAGVLLLAPSAASASPSPDGEPFGQHVRRCAQTMGFSGHHNPGMHQGNAGWDGIPCHQ